MGFLVSLGPAVASQHNGWLMRIKHNTVLCPSAVSCRCLTSILVMRLKMTLCAIGTKHLVHAGVRVGESSIPRPC